jgi:hypothetical protein
MTTGAIIREGQQRKRRYLHVVRTCHLDLSSGLSDSADGLAAAKQSKLMGRPILHHHARSGVRSFSAGNICVGYLNLLQHGHWKWYR